MDGFDHKWRQATDKGRTWRLANFNDLPRLNELWDGMEQRLGKQDRPDLFAMPVTLTLVAEDETGTVVAGIYGEAVIDWTMIGTDRKTAESINDLFPMLRQYLGERSIRVARVLVPKRLAKGMAEALPQMVEIGHLFASFVCVIRL